MSATGSPPAPTYYYQEVERKLVPMWQGAPLKLCRSFLHTVAVLLQKFPLTGRYFTAQQQRGNLFMRFRSRWKIKLSWHAFAQREIGIWAGRRTISKQGIARKTRSGTVVNQWFFFILLFKGLLSTVTKKWSILFPAGVKSERASS